MHAERPQATDKHADKARARFCSKVSKVDGCWLWQAQQHKQGYGIFWYKNKDRLVHRVSYIIFTGKLIQTDVVRHTCDTPQCVNPKHLVKGTQKDNMQDAVVRDRIARGSASGRSKLSKHDVQNIRKDGRPINTIAKDYNVDWHSIKDILTRKNWSHI